MSFSHTLYFKTSIFSNCCYDIDAACSRKNCLTVCYFTFARYFDLCGFYTLRFSQEEEQKGET